MSLSDVSGSGGASKEAKQEAENVAFRTGKRKHSPPPNPDRVWARAPGRRDEGLPFEDSELSQKNQTSTGNLLSRD